LCGQVVCYTGMSDRLEDARQVADEALAAPHAIGEESGLCSLIGGLVVAVNLAGHGISSH
jgi:hypothetical protein